MTPTQTARVGLLAGGLLLPALFVGTSLSSANSRMEEAAAAPSSTKPTAAIAAADEAGYCTKELKEIVRRVAGSCGLLSEGGRGCKPTDAKSVATMTGADFNALFMPLKERVRIVQFDTDNTSLDAGAQQAIEQAWADQRGASFFFVVARASSDGNAAYNTELSATRAQNVLQHLENKFHDPELKKTVGLLWLGEEYAQLSKDFCSWSRSRTGDCSQADINRSAFVAWIDCAI